MRRRIVWSQTLVDAAVTRFGRVDIMVNNAGIETRTSVLDTTEDQYDKVMAINLKTAFFGTQIAAKQNDQAGRWRSHHQPHLGPRGLADARQHRLLPRQRWHAHANPHRRHRTGQIQHPCRRGGSGCGGDADQPRHDERPAKLAQLDAAVPLGRMARPEESPA
jgi:glucose 1-dehydrogenase